MLGQENHTDRSLFYRQLATTLDAGVSAQESISILQRDTGPTGDRARELERLLRNPSLDLGEVLARTEKDPVVGKARAAVLRAAYRSGRLVEALHSLAKDAEEQQKARRKFRTAMIRPGILALAAPTLPTLPILVTKGLGAYLAITLPAMLILGVLIGLMVAGGRTLAGIPRTVPLLGPLARETALARATLSLHHYFNAGMPLWEAFHGAGDAAGLGPEGDAIKQIAKHVERGGTIADGFARSTLPPVLTGFMRVGEQSGNLAEMALLAHRHHGESADHQMGKTIRVIAFFAFAISMTLAARTVIQFWTGHFDSLSKAVDG